MLKIFTARGAKPDLSTLQFVRNVEKKDAPGMVSLQLNLIYEHIWVCDVKKADSKQMFCKN
jgi:hypothetical protein